MTKNRQSDALPVFSVNYSSSQFVRHLIRHTVEVSVRVKKARSKPAKIAPIMLVAAKVIPRRITDVKTVPRIPQRRTFKEEQTQLLCRDEKEQPEVASRMARYTTAMPKRTHEKAGVIVIVPIKRSMPAMMPIIMLATMAKTGQLILQVQEESSDI